ncbi:hypothetical protein FGE12_19695 [Aggregicoccus sp. 17bor-14]|uniref:hypothetical protein n=1 Tax=Myxococcaceae TaxID=31 RepID=UPI00129C2F38|nr:MULTISPECIES: hypothetical protein [Myxococcaceae]MBF5044634.1 hypothetical protein [Simulacricoccus sp. 17bor-14]MRI90378.1 hypothetical protein [Aggregicoccus sp. 17bor-14]
MHPLRLSLALFLCCALFAGCAATRSSTTCPAEHGATWRELRSEHFRLRTDLESQEAARALVQLERYRRAVLLDWVQHFDPPGTTDVVLLQDSRALQTLIGRRALWAGRVTLDGAELLLSADQLARLDEVGSSTTLSPLYVLAYPLTWQAMPAEPRWLAEGLARYVQTVQLEKGGHVTLGDPQRAALKALRDYGRLLSIEQLWRWGVHAPEHAGASAWLWVHYLLSAQPQRFSDFRTRLHHGEEAYAAFQATFAGVDWNQEQQRLAAYAMKGDYRIVRTELPEVFVDPQLRRMEDGDVHRLRAELAAWSGQGAAAHQQRVREEAALAQQHDAAGFSTRWLAAAARPVAERLDAARQLARDFPQEAEAWQLLADMLELADGPAGERAEALTRALALAPQLPHTLNSYAWYFANEGADAARALEPARTAMRLAPHHPYVVDTYALVMAKLGHCEEARALQRRALTRITQGDPSAPRMSMRLEDYEQRCKPAGTATTASP